MERKHMRKMDHNNNHSTNVKRADRPDVIRRKRKPMMEKRRRARINASLEQLKKLVLDATRRDSARYSKLEKADILELTVKHIKDVQTIGVLQDPHMLAKLQDGFGECISEVNRCMSSFEGVPAELRNRMMAHLSTCLQRRTQQNMSAFPVLANFPAFPMLPPQQDMSAAFHPLSSPGGVPSATPLQTIPGAFDSRNSASSSPRSPLEAEARAFQNALLQAQATTDFQERTRCMERLLNSRHGQAGLARQINRLNNMKTEQLAKMKISPENLYLRERMLASFEQGDNVWRPW